MPEILFNRNDQAQQEDVPVEGNFARTVMEGKNTNGLWDYLMRYAFKRGEDAPKPWVKQQIMKYFGKEE